MANIITYGELAYTNKQLRLIQEHFSKVGVESLILTSDKADDQKSAGVRLCTMHRAKGLEFKAVAVPFMSNALFPPKWLLDKAIDEADKEDTETQLKALLHVAATRAKGFLRVSWSGERSIRSFSYINRMQRGIVTNHSCALLDLDLLKALRNEYR
ncbi:MAG: superfamily I DNA/RNA helicase [Planctomycetota bacterium]|jgi:superfamily I DNA/RNA helicase